MSTTEARKTTNPAKTLISISGHNIDLLCFSGTMLATLVACKRWPLKATTFLVRNLLNEQRSVLITSGRVILLSSHGLLQPPTDTSGVELHSGLRRSGSLIREAAAGCYRFFSRGVNAICIVLRALQLAVIFTPFFIISPLAAWSDTFKPVWFRVLVWTLETSGPGKSCT